MNAKEKIETLVEEFNALGEEIMLRQQRQLEIKGAVEALNEIFAVDEAADETTGLGTTRTSSTTTTN